MDISSSQTYGTGIRFQGTVDVRYGVRSRKVNDNPLGNRNNRRRLEQCKRITELARRLAKPHNRATDPGSRRNTAVDRPGINGMPCFWDSVPYS